MKTAQMPSRLNRKADIQAFLKEHPTWVLQWCKGIRFHTWWWVREKRDRGDVVMCHASAAYAVSKEMKLVHTDILHGSTYALETQLAAKP